MPIATAARATAHTPSFSLDHLTLHLAAHRRLDRLHVQLPSQRLIGLLGPKGSGKTTLLRSLWGILPPTSGSVRLFGHDLQDMTPNELVRLISWVSSVAVTQKPVSVLDFVLSGSRWRDDLSGQPEARLSAAMACLERVGRVHLASRIYYQQSPLDRHYLALARALLAETPVILIDQADCAESFKTHVQQEAYLSFLRQLAHQGRTIVAVFEHPALGMSHCDWLLYLEQGRMTACGSSSACLSHQAFADMAVRLAPHRVRSA